MSNIKVTFLLFHSWARASGTSGIGKLVGPGAAVDASEKRKISYTCHESNQHSSVVPPVA